ncbi:hypothetical protein H4S04_000171 [Coemansia sp. S16]|nr:hypothetical protein H4S04_000171 [Coemansia sp. S16]KAJ2072117.1 hypothetical protein GGH13_002905 [Coemansia sp. S155-1]
MTLRYNSPAVQLSLLALTLLLTTAVRRLLNSFLMHEPPNNINLTYDSYLPTSIISCVAGFAGIFLANLAGIRSILLFYSFTSILYLSSIIVVYQYDHYTFHTACNIINSAAYDLSRVATLVVVLAYPNERWKARALATFLILEYFAMTMGNIIAISDHSSENSRLHSTIAALCLACLSPFVAVAIAPTHDVVRNNGVYLIARKTTLRDEIKETIRLFKNKYMLLLLPYMFCYPFLFGVAYIPFPNIEAIVLYDVGRLIVVFTSQMLDVQWASRRTRGLMALLITSIFCTASSILTIVMRRAHMDLSGIKPSWGETEILAYVMDIALSEYAALMYATYFFAGVASSSVEFYGFWVMGTLTNDLKASARFVGTFHSVMSIGGLIGIELVTEIPHHYTTSNSLTYIAFGMSLISFMVLFVVVQSITESNDWTLGRMRNSSAPDTLSSPDGSSETVAVIAEVKYQHHNNV